MVELKRIGLTGGVAAGKTEVANMLRAAGILVVDMDTLAREITETDPKVKDELKSLFGTLDRKQIRKQIFEDPSLKLKLESLLHPRIHSRFEQECGKAAASGKPLIVGEAALLVESGYRRSFDELIVVTASASTRKARLLARDQITELLADQMLRAQCSDEEKKQWADTIIQNNGDRDQLRVQVDALLGRWKR